MKTTIKIGSIRIGEAIVNGIEVSQECEAREVVELIKEISKEIRTWLPQSIKTNIVNSIEEAIMDKEDGRDINPDVRKEVELIEKENGGSFSYCYSNNIECIEKELAKKKYNEAREIIKATINMCKDALDKEEISEDTYMECIEELVNMDFETQRTIVAVEGDNSFSYYYTSSIEAIHDDISHGRMLSAKKKISEAHKLCVKALHSKEIDLDIYISCINELQQLLIRIEEVSF